MSCVSCQSAQRGLRFRISGDHERLSRIAAQQARLPGIKIEAHLEPSYQMMDRVSAMSDVQIIGYLPPAKCTGRAQELSSKKTETQLTFDSADNLRSSKKAADLEASVTGELALREALQRRSLAFDAGALMTYEVGESGPRCCSVQCRRSRP